MSRLPRAILMLVMLGLARAGGATPADRPVSLELQDADVHGVLRLLAEVGGFDVAVGEGVKGKVTLRLDRVAWDQALDVVLRTQGLQARREGRVLRIATDDELGRERDAACRNGRRARAHPRRRPSVRWARRRRSPKVRACSTGAVASRSTRGRERHPGSRSPPADC